MDSKANQLENNEDDREARAALDAEAKDGLIALACFLAIPVFLIIGFAMDNYFLMPLGICLFLAWGLRTVYLEKKEQDDDPYQIRRDDKAYTTEREKQAEQKRQADLIGDAKYIDGYERQLKLAKTMAEGWKFIEKNNLQNTHAQAQTSSWAIHGGFADAIAGPAAGVAVALDVQRQNAEAEARAAATREEASNNIGFFASRRGNAEREQKSLESIESEVRSFFKGHQIDTLIPREKFKAVVTKTGEVEITPCGTLHVDVRAAVSSQANNGSQFFAFDNTTGILDGSFRVIAKSFGKPIGEGFYNPPVPTFSANRNWRSLWGMPGLPCEAAIRESEREVILIPFAGEKFTCRNQYTIEIEPYHLWYIDLGFKPDGAIQ